MRLFYYLATLEVVRRGGRTHSKHYTRVFLCKHAVEKRGGGGRHFSVPAGAKRGRKPFVAAPAARFLSQSRVPPPDSDGTIRNLVSSFFNRSITLLLQETVEKIVSRVIGF